MKYKALLLDLDGVICTSRYFSEIYSEEFGVDIEKLRPFFGEKKDATNLDKADLKELLADVLDEWEWKGTVDELVNYWVNSDTDMDERFVGVTQKIRENGAKVYLATDQEKFRTAFVWNERGLKNWIDGKFISCEIELVKSNPEFFNYIAKELGIKTEEMVFFDDSLSKVESAKEAGVEAHVYEGFDSFLKKLGELGLVTA